VEGTIPIGQAVQELGLDATPEEILAEVQAQRVPQRRVPWPKRKRRLAGIVGAGLAGVVLARLLALPFMHSPEAPAVTNTATLVASYTPPSPVVRTLAEVPDEHPVVCTSNQLKILLNISHPSLKRMLVQDVHPHNGDPTWCLVKHHGQLYLHGYRANMTEEAMRVGGISLRNSRMDDTGIGGLSYVTPASFRIGAFTCTGSPQSRMAGSALQITDVHPDGYANEALKGVDRG